LTRRTKKENKNPITFLKISFAGVHLAHLTLPQPHKPTTGAKSKEPNLSAQKKIKTLGELKILIFVLFTILVKWL
jgi:hypothetical protein